MNNPMMAMMQMMQSGRNPMQLLQQMAGQNPQAASNTSAAPVLVLNRFM